MLPTGTPREPYNKLETGLGSVVSESDNFSSRLALQHCRSKERLKLFDNRIKTIVNSLLKENVSGHPIHEKKRVDKSTEIMKDPA